MSDLDELRDAVAGSRSTVKSLLRVARGALGVLTDLEERLAALEENAQPEEAQRDQHNDSVARRNDQYEARQYARTGA